MVLESKYYLFSETVTGHVCIEQIDWRDYNAYCKVGMFSRIFTRADNRYHCVFDFLSISEEQAVAWWKRYFSGVGVTNVSLKN